MILYKKRCMLGSSWACYKSLWTNGNDISNDSGSSC